ncbi:MAG TPA: hypothetical protein VIW29_01175 [Polyangiaceae bacterium]
MTEPTRIIDEAGADDLELSLLRLARSEAPSADGRRRVMAGVAAMGVASLASQSAEAAKLGAHGLSSGVKWALLGIAAVALPSVLWLLSGEPEPATKLTQPGALQAPASEVTPPSAPAHADGPAPLTLDDLPALPANEPAASAGAKPQGSLAEEVAQLQKAKLALKGGNPAEALSELNVYAQRFPRPRLGAEATMVRIEALSASGNAARAKTLAEGFLAKNPNSPYAARLRSLTGAR